MKRSRTSVDNSIKGKVILITGGTGTIGRALVKELLPLQPAAIRIYARDEAKQFDLMNEFSDSVSEMRFLIGDVRDKPRLAMATEGVDIIFHLAAMKHVLLSSYNPFEAVKTNIIGTQNVIEVALENEVSSVIYSSSDKAVNPTNTMGTSKLMAEQLMVSANCYRGKHKTVFASVRFGNVLGSRGSAVPLFIKQINGGQNLTITNPSMTRFIMTSSRSCQLLIKSAEMALGGETFVFKMPQVRLHDLIDALCTHFDSFPKRDIIGEFPYEKMDEELMTMEESSRSLETDEMFVVLPPPYVRQLINKEYKYRMATRPAAIKSYSSANNTFLSAQEIITLLKEGEVLT